MAECECLGGCIFFNDKMKNMPAMAEQYKKKFCTGDNEKCARYFVFKAMGRENVPPTLFPNQMEEAQHIVLTG